MTAKGECNICGEQSADETALAALFALLVATFILLIIAYGAYDFKYGELAQQKQRQEALGKTVRRKKRDGDPWA